MTRSKKGTFTPGTSGNPGGKSKGFRTDGWESALTGIGTATHDKRTSHDFVPSALSYEKCIEIFEGDDLGKRAAAGPVEDAFRPGYEISITDEGEFDDLKNDIEDRLRELKVDKVLKKALTQKRALGGSAILVGVNDNKAMDRPMDHKTVTKIEFLTNLEPLDLQPHTFYDDPLDAKFGEVKLWELRSMGNYVGVLGTGQTVKSATTEKQKGTYIHESRLIIFNQDMISKYSTTYNPAGYFWGLSIYVQIYEILRDFNVAWSAAGLLVTDFSQSVFKIENLMQLVSRDEDKLRQRMQAMQMGRSVARAVLIDTKEEFENQTTNVAGLSDLLNQIARRFAASIDTPLSLLMSSGARSDAAEVGDELRYYYDRLSVMHTDEINPVLRWFVEIIMREHRSYKIPKHWGVKWRPFWQPTEEQSANARLAQARVDAIYIKHGVLDPDTVAKVRFTGEYSFETPLGSSYKAPGFMALPPLGALVNGLDPNTGLLPGAQPDAQHLGKGATTGTSGGKAVAVAPHARNTPRVTSMTQGGDNTAGGATGGKIDHRLDGPQIETLANIVLAVHNNEMSVASAKAILFSAYNMNVGEANDILGIENEEIENDEVEIEIDETEPHDIATCELDECPVCGSRSPAGTVGGSTNT